MLEFIALPFSPRCAMHRQVISLLAVAAIALAQTACGSGDPVAEAKQLQAQGAFEASLEPLRRHLEGHPDDAEAQFLYGFSLSSMGRLTEAIWPLRRAAEDPDWATPATLQLARIAIATSDWDSAAALLDELLEREPENIEALGIRAFARAQSRRDYEGALADADAVLVLAPTHSDGLILRAVALLGLDRIDEAREAILAASDHFEEAGLGLAGSPDFCAVRAGFADEQGDKVKAQEIFEECLERFPTHFTILDGAVRFFDSIGQSDRSLEILRGAHAALPNVRTYRMSLVFRLGLRGEHEEAEQILVDATRATNPALAAIAFSDLAAYYFEQDRLTDAIEMFEKTLTLIPDPGPTFMFAYADTLVTAGRQEEALALTAEMKLPSHRELIRGRVALESGDPGTALAHFEEGFKLWPANAVARYFAGLAAEQLGDFDRAIEEYRYSIRSDAAVTEARLRLARLYAASDRPTLALEVVRHNAAQTGIDAVERTLLEIELLARLGQAVMIAEASRAIAQSPEHLAEAVAARASGVRTRAGPEAAIREVTGAEGLDLNAPLNVKALDSLVLDLVTLGRASEALARVDQALAASGSKAGFHALRGSVIVLTAVDPEQARPEFDRALTLDPANARALIGLARLASAAGRTDEALDLYARAAAADESDATALREAAGLSQTAGRSTEAARLLEAVLERDPYAGTEALQLAKIMLDANAEARDSARVRALLRTAAYFGEGEEATDLLEAIGPPDSTQPGDA